MLALKEYNLLANAEMKRGEAKNNNLLDQCRILDEHDTKTHPHTSLQLSYVCTFSKPKLTTLCFNASINLSISSIEVLCSANNAARTSYMYMCIHVY